jgi:hypothetical protein
MLGKTSSKSGSLSGSGSKWKGELDRIAAMLSRLGGRGYCVKEELEQLYGSTEFDPDSDFDKI